MKTIRTILLLIGISLSAASFAQGQSFDQTVVRLPKRLANQVNCTITLINLDSREKFSYVTNFTEQPVIQLDNYPSGQVYYYSITVKGDVVNKGNFFYPLQVNKPVQVASNRVD